MRPHRVLKSLVFLTIWLLVWAVLGIFSILYVPWSTLGDKLIYPVVMMVVWGLGLVISLSAYLWILIGREIIKIGSETLLIEKGLLGFFRRKSFPVDKLAGFQIAEDYFNNPRQGSTFGRFAKTIEFKIAGKLERCGSLLTRTEAEKVLVLLKEHLPGAATSG